MHIVFLLNYLFVIVLACTFSSYHIHFPTCADNNMLEVTKIYVIILVVLISTSLRQCMGSKLPSISFLETFTQKLNTEGLNIYLPKNAFIDHKLNKIVQHFR